MAEEKALDKKQWGAIYNQNLCEQVIQAVSKDEVFCWTEELLNITKKGDKLCEVGCGSGQSAAYLQKYGRNVAALDFSEESVALVNAVNESLKLGMRVVCADATKPLPFAEKEFDYIYQCGLLELPQYSLCSEFEKAGITNVKEYTIGAEHALMFLPAGHYLREALIQWIIECKELGMEDLCGQGYLLVTIGDCE